MPDIKVKFPFMVARRRGSTGKWVLDEVTTEGFDKVAAATVRLLNARFGPGVMPPPGYHPRQDLEIAEWAAAEFGGRVVPNPAGDRAARRAHRRDRIY